MEEVFDEVSVESYTESNGKNCYEWKDHGMKMELPAGCTVKFKLKTVSSDKFDLPEETQQLSPVYWVESKGKVEGAVGVELQHSAEVTQEGQKNGLRFAMCKVELGMSTRKFELEKGEFSHGSYGKVKVNQFSIATWLVTIVRYNSATDLSPVFLANLYYQKMTKSIGMMNFIVVPRQDAWEKVTGKFKNLSLYALLECHCRCCLSIMTQTQGSFAGSKKSQHSLRRKASLCIYLLLVVVRHWRMIK